MKEELFEISYSRDEIAPQLSAVEWNEFVDFAERKFDHADTMETLGIILDVFQHNKGN